MLKFTYLYYYIFSQKFFVTRRINKPCPQLQVIYSQWPFSAGKFRTSKSCSVFLRHMSLIVKMKQTKYYRTVRCSCEDMFVFDSCSLFWIVPYKRVHTTETTGLLTIWKKTTTAIRVSVSKLYVTFFLWCCRQTEGWGDCFLKFLDQNIWT